MVLSQNNKWTEQAHATSWIVSAASFQVLSSCSESLGLCLWQPSLCWFCNESKVPFSLCCLCVAVCRSCKLSHCCFQLFIYSKTFNFSLETVLVQTHCYFRLLLLLWFQGSAIMLSCGGHWLTQFSCNLYIQDAACSGRSVTSNALGDALMRPPQ